MDKLTKVLESSLFEEKTKISLSKDQLREIKTLKKDIQRQVYTFEDVSCECCGGEAALCLSHFDRYGLSYKSNLCQACGLIYTSPRFNQESYIRFYDSCYREIYTSPYGNYTKEDFFNNQVSTGKRILNFLKKYRKLDHIKNVLEVGCGMGGILVPFRENGCKVKGVDFGSEYIRLGKKNNLDLQVGGISEVDGKFDLIIYSHVFEHILSIEDELSEISKRMNNNGLLYIEVPGIFNLRAYRYQLSRYFQNAHTYNFSLITLQNILSKSGFEFIGGNEEIKSLFKFSKRKLPYKVQNDSNRILNYLSDLKFKRITWYLTTYGIREIIIIFLKKVFLFDLIKQTKKNLTIIKK